MELERFDTTGCPQADANDKAAAPLVGSSSLKPKLAALGFATAVSPIRNMRLKS